MRAKRNLVVIGNGMSGARAVEEILARGGAELFTIAMFGDEPFGNYNRIMLSSVLAGDKSVDEIVINSREWYAENDITLITGDAVKKIDREARTVISVAGVSVSRHGSLDRVVVAAVVIVMAWALVVRQAFALSDAPAIARAIELGAPLGRVGLPM